MTLNIEFSPQASERLAAAARTRGVDPATMLELLVVENLPAVEDAPTAAARAKDGSAPDHFYFTATPEEFARALRELADMNKDLPALPDEAFDRESIYEDRD